MTATTPTYHVYLPDGRTVSLRADGLEQSEAELRLWRWKTEGKGHTTEFVAKFNNWYGWQKDDR